MPITRSTATTHAAPPGPGLTLEQVMRAQHYVDAGLGECMGQLREDASFIVYCHRERSWRERLLSWPWRPWRRIARWIEPDPNLYQFRTTRGLALGQETYLVGHPATVRSVRAALYAPADD